MPDTTTDLRVATYVSVRIGLTLPRRTFRVEESTGTVDVHTLHVSIGADERTYIDGSGHVVRKDGSLGTGNRRVYSLRMKDLPDEIRAAVRAAFTEAIAGLPAELSAEQVG